MQHHASHILIILAIIVQGSSSNEANLAQLQQETSKAIEEVKGSIQSKKESVVSMLSSAVLNVKVQ